MSIGRKENKHENKLTIRRKKRKYDKSKDRKGREKERKLQVKYIGCDG